MSKTKSWLKAFRLRTLPLSLSGIIVGNALANYFGHINWLLFVLALFSVLFLQILSNLANDLGDSLKGTDNENRVGPKRSVQSGEISKKAMKNAVIIFSILSLITLFPLAYLGTKNLSDAALYFYLFLAIACIVAAITYTIGKKAYGYLGFGDLFVFLFFGTVSVCGIYGLIAKEWSPFTLLPATAIGLLSTAVLNLNNMRDYENDKTAKKRTLVVKIGFQNAKIYHGILLFLPSICVVGMILLTHDIGFVFLLSIYGVLIPHYRYVLKEKVNANLDSELKKVALTTFAMSILLTLWVWI